MSSKHIEILNLIIKLIYNNYGSFNEDNLCIYIIFIESYIYISGEIEFSLLWHFEQIQEGDKTSSPICC